MKPNTDVASVVPLPGPFISPSTDTGFKRIFGREATKDILIAFLNSVLPSELQTKELDLLA
jgi:hypothetical protein